jgi:dipeptidyl aminopeptidase/acylaminoacyl peptidase
VAVLTTRSLRGRHVFTRAELVLAAALAVSCGGAPPPKPAAPPPPVAKPKPPPRPKAVAIPNAPVDEPPAVCAEHERALADLFATFLDAHVVRGQDISPDGSTLLYTSTQGGRTPQLYIARVDQPAAAGTLLAESKDAVLAARFTPDGKRILFIRDHQRDENTQIYEVAVGTRAVKAATTNPKRYHRLPLSTRDGQKLVYFEGAQASPRTTLVERAASGGKSRKVFEGEGFHFLTDLSRDGQLALVFKLKSLSESQLLLVEVGGGRVTELAPSPGKKAHANVAAFSADEKSIYVVTDEGGEVAGLNRIHPETGKVLASYRDRVAEVEDVAVSRTEPVVAVLLDEGSHQSVKLLDAASLEVRAKARVKLPLGTVRMGKFTEDGKSLLVGVSTPSEPGDILLVSAKNGKAQSIRKERRPGLKKLSRVNATVEKIPTFDAFEVPINVFLPRRLPAKKRLPVIVLVHGGPAASASIGWDAWIGFYLASGFAVVAPNVRGSTGFGKLYEQADNGVKRLDALKDLEAVNRWIRAQRWADPERLVVMGASYGGYMTYMALGTQPDLWRCGVGACGVVNLRTFLASTTGAIRLVLADEFGRLETDGPLLDSISPIHVVEKLGAPLFVYQGAKDPRVPRSEQDQLVLALRRRGVPVEYMVALDEGHSFDQKATQLAFLSRSVRFLEQHLDLPGVPEACKAARAAAKPPAAKPAPASAPAAEKTSKTH